jgi:anaerobic ribonucleoside-triphosphate reductase
VGAIWRSRIAHDVANFANDTLPTSEKHLHLEAMTQFYVTTEADVRRCKESLDAGTSVRVAGRAADGKTTTFEGVVQSVEEDVKRDPDKRWRVTLRD